MTLPITTPETGEDMLAAVDGLRESIRSRALEGERARRVPEETIEELERAGVFRMSVPTRFGGLELPLTDQVRVLAAIARADVSASWVSALHTVGAYFVGHYPDEVQEEVFTSPDVRVATQFTPGKLVPVAGGYRLTGAWPFATGCHSSHWDCLVAVVDDGTDAPPRAMIALVSMDDLTILDDWDPAGLAATGSHTVLADDMFVPERRILPMAEAVGGLNLSDTTKDSPLYKTGFLPFLLVASMGTPVGAAEAALDAFLARIPGRTITYTSWKYDETPITHVVVAEAASTTTAAALLRDDLARRVTEAGESGRELSVAERAAIRGDVAEVTKLSRTAVRQLADLASASSIQRAEPIQRVHRDMDALSLHGVLAFNTSFEIAGRVLVGQDPATTFL